MTVCEGDAAPGVGKVFLVGAGPGDPGLITLRGRECLAAADEVLYDGLVNPLLLRLTTAYAARTSRVEGPTGRRLNQEEINARLIALARQGKTVVRLKGGDPFIFGRGAEEAEALHRAGIPFEVVPGITAAVAAAEYAGITFTHRESASAVAFITGHEDPSKPHSNLDYDALARFPGTLVFYMGLHRLPAIVSTLLAAGMPDTTPAAVICRGTTSQQRTMCSTLGAVADEVVAAGLAPPSLIVVGPTAARREGLAWFERKPLLSKRIGITRPDDLADPQIARALSLGAEPIIMPLIRIEPLTDWTRVDQTLERLDEFDWLIFTSVNGVRALLQRLWDRGQDLRRLGKAQIAAIGPATADALAEFHLRADIVPPEFRAESLAAELKRVAGGARVLWARANRGRDVLPESLKAAGAQVEEVIVYRNEDVAALPPPVETMLAAGELDWICLSSPSIARALADLIGDDAREHLGTRTRIAAISPVTAQAASEAGLPVAAVATTFTWDGLFDAVLEAEGLSPASHAPIRPQNHSGEWL